MNLIHTTVYSQPGMYAGWPANHGAWQWGDEFLVGFIRGTYKVGGIHNITGVLEKVQARSLDGGQTWTVEEPNVEFSSAHSQKPSPYFELNDAIIRVCGCYDYGGEDCNPLGGFYASLNRGKIWSGAFTFDGIEKQFSPPMHNTSRTCTPGKNLVLLSRATKKHWGSDEIICVKHDGRLFGLISTVCADDSRAVMPAAAWMPSGAIVVVARRRGTKRPGGWIDAFRSIDEGRTWQFTSHVADTGVDNGNPPALIEHEGILYCAYGNRSLRGIYVNVSHDEGKTWHHYTTRGIAGLRTAGKSDIGYPRLFKRSDGRLVCVYYWASAEYPQQRIVATAFDPM